MQTARLTRAKLSTPTTTLYHIVKPATQSRKMAYLFPRLSFGHPAVRCGPAFRNSYTSNEIAPLFNWFDDAFNELDRASRQMNRQPAPFAPKFDVKEVEDAYHLEGELPGVDQKDLTIEFTDEHTLTIKGRTERTYESGTRPAALEAESEQQGAIEDAASATSEAGTGTKSPRAATVEDEADADKPATTESTTATAATATATDENAVTKAAAETEAEASKTPGSHYWVSERSVGSFSRSFNFGSRVDQDHVKASLKNGVLSIVVPKATAPVSRRIQIE